MANKKNNLDVDFIGGQGPLTDAEEKALSNYFKKSKLKRSEKPKRRKISNRKLATN